MSAEAAPISPARFAKALEDLPVSALHGKASELRNSIAHLQDSNTQMEDYLRENEADRDIYEAIMENRVVIERMEHRIELIKKEVTEVRCLPWEPAERKTAADAQVPTVNGSGNEAGASVTNGAPSDSTASRVRPESGTGAGDRDRNAAPADEEEGVFL